VEVESARPNAAAMPSSPSRPARPWLAALLSLLQVGLGHLYLWRPGLAFALWAAFFAATVVGWWAALRLPGAVGIAIGVALVLAVYAAVARHAWRLARRTPPQLPRPRPPILALSLVGFYLLFTLPGGRLRDWTKRNVVEAFRIPSGAMEPTILSGDYLLVSKRRSAPLERDRLITYEKDGNALLKRVVGLAGDTLEMRAGQLYRNGRAVAEPYARREGEGSTASEDFRWQRSILAPGRDTAAYRATIDAWGPLVVPAGRVFVLGDNRHLSLDSRYVGPIDADSVTGRPLKVYFSREPGGAIRWGRIGVQLDQR